MSGRELRIARLEEGLFFQERLVQDLNAALTGQQRQIDRMEKELLAAKEKIAELAALLDESGGVNLPPPHYRE